jgi:hypothetical protein
MASSSSVSSSSSLSLPSLNPMQPFVIPKHEDTEAVWQSFIKDSTEKVDGVAADQAQLIFLGNIHSEKWWQKDWRGEIIKRYGPDAIVLCEGFAACKPVTLNNVSSFTPKSNVSVFGWDDMQISKDHTAVQQVVALREKYKEYVPSSKWSPEDRNLWTMAEELNSKNCMLRTHSLIKTARVFLRGQIKQGQKLIVISGSDHLFCEGYNILNYFKGIKASLILPKLLSSGLNEDIEYAKKLAQS